MRTVFHSKVIWLICLLATAVLSFFCIAPHMTQPSTYQNSLNTLQGKQETVLELTAVSAAASTAITVLPGDVATPIADKLADLSGYFLIVLCAIFLEKYLLTITASATFYVLIPLSCALCAAYVLSAKRFFGELAWKVACFGFAIVLVVPTSVYVSNVIEETYNTSISTTIEDAKRVTEEAQTADKADDAEESHGISGLFSKVTEGISKATTETVNKFKLVLNNMIEALAVMLVTSCLIPILVIVFFTWLFKLIFGINIPLPSHDSITKAKPMAHQKQDS